MRWLVSEYFLSGAWRLEHPEEPPPDSLMTEGIAMVQAICRDLGKVQDHVSVLMDAEQPIALPDAHPIPTNNELHDLVKFADQFDWVLVIAPEFEDELVRRIALLEQTVPDRVFSPPLEFVELASDKSETAERLHQAGIPVPEGRKLLPGESFPLDFPLPGVLKLNDGAGSYGTRLIETYQQGKAAWREFSRPARLEAFCSGTPASIACLGQIDKPVLLPPCKQQISSDGNFSYQGGSLPLRADLTERATQLARRVFAEVPFSQGYAGIDLILGETAAEDYVLEINPRITTSFLGLTAATQNSLLHSSVLQVPVEPWAGNSIEFTPEGRVFPQSLQLRTKAAE